MTQRATTLVLSRLCNYSLDVLYVVCIQPVAYHFSVPLLRAARQHTAPALAGAAFSNLSCCSAHSRGHVVLLLLSWKPAFGTRTR